MKPVGYSVVYLPYFDQNKFILIIQTENVLNNRSKTNYNLTQIQNRTNYGRFRIQAIGNILFNKLPTNVKTIQTKKIFKKEFKKWIIHDPNYLLYNFL